MQEPHKRDILEGPGPAGVVDPRRGASERGRREARTQDLGDPDRECRQPALGEVEAPERAARIDREQTARDPGVRVALDARTAEYVGGSMRSGSRRQQDRPRRVPESLDQRVVLARRGWLRELHVDRDQPCPVAAQAGERGGVVGTRDRILMGGIDRAFVDRHDHDRARPCDLRSAYSEPGVNGDQLERSQPVGQHQHGDEDRGDQRQTEQRPAPALMQSDDRALGPGTAARPHVRYARIRANRSAARPGGRPGRSRAAVSCLRRRSRRPRLG